MTGRPCEVPTDAHEGRSRLYPCGWRCTTHAPPPRPVQTDTPGPTPRANTHQPRTTTEGAQAA